MDFPDLLDATIRHLEDAKANGVRHVNVDPENLRALAQPLAGQAPTVEVQEARRQRPQSPAAPSTTPALRPIPVVEERPMVAADPALDPKKPLSRAEKEKAFADLRGRAEQCVKCDHLVRARRSVVFGVGNIHTELMFVGEAPGMDEDAQGEPFVGKAGELLNKIIGAMGLKRDEIYIGNVLKCRPDTPGQRYGNRKPTPSEMATCLPYLASQIDIIRPKVIICLGATAVEGLFGKSQMGITRLRGTWMKYRDYPVMPTFHPAYLLRNQAHTEKRKVWEDMLAAMDRLGLPISEKQRGYFLKK